MSKEVLQPVAGPGIGKRGALARERIYGEGPASINFHIIMDTILCSCSEIFTVDLCFYW